MAPVEGLIFGTTSAWPDDHSSSSISSMYSSSSSVLSPGLTQGPLSLSPYEKKNDVILTESCMDDDLPVGVAIEEDDPLLMLLVLVGAVAVVLFVTSSWIEADSNDEEDTDKFDDDEFLGPLESFRFKRRVRTFSRMSSTRRRFVSKRPPLPLSVTISSADGLVAERGTTRVFSPLLFIVQIRSTIETQWDC